VSEITNKLQT